MNKRENIMRAFRKHFCFGFWLSATLAASSFAQKALTWQEVRDKFEKANPTLLAGQVGVEES
jgi:hypothetical protein